MSTQADLPDLIAGDRLHASDREAITDAIVLGPFSWVHPLCDLDTYLSHEDERRHEADRERGL